MKKLAVLGMGLCIALAFSSCKSSESAYKKAYEKAKQQELAEPQTTAPVEEVAPVVSAPVEAKVVESAPVGTIREEKVTVVSGADGLKDYSVVCGSFGVKANAENLKNIRFYFNHDLTDNIILRGLPAATQRVKCGCKDKIRPEKARLR